MNHDTDRMALAAPIERWDEAIPLGDGQQGVLLWGDDRCLRLSLDRGDLWDERTGGVYGHPLWNYRSVTAACLSGDRETLDRIEALSETITATKISAGRVEFAWAPEGGLSEFELDFATGLAAVRDAAGRIVAECFCASDSGLIYLRCRAGEVRPRLVPPPYQGRGEVLAEAGTVRNAASLGFPPGERGEAEGLLWYIQPSCEDWCYGIFLREIAPGDWIIRVHRGESATAMGEFKERWLAGEPTAGFEAAAAAAAAWWRAFAARVEVRLPDRELERHYNFCRYLYGAGSRRGCEPLPLQGLWTADDGSLPPWRGDFHHDLNTQFCYLPYLGSGDFDCGLSFLEYLSQRLPVFREFARSFYGVEGVAVPGVTSLAGQALGGWAPYSFSPGNVAWLACMFVDHWRYTRDREFLRETAWPFLSGAAQFLAAMLEEEGGFLILRLSSSPEIHDNRLEAWLTPMSNYDLALLHSFWRGFAEAAGELGEDDRGAAAILARLQPLHIDPDKGLKLSPDELLTESHRHHAHLMAIHPLRLLDPRDPADAKTIADSLRQLETLGTEWWCGYSFSWLAGIYARQGDGARAYRMLRIFLDAFCSRNGFHLNGDFKRLGHSNFDYRPFTLEGNFGAMAAVQEMLLQSDGYTIRLFPALPPEWRDVEFRDLCCDGGFSVSAVLRDGAVTEYHVTAAEERPADLVLPDGRRISL